MYEGAEQSRHFGLVALGEKRYDDAGEYIAATGCGESGSA